MCNCIKNSDGTVQQPVVTSATAGQVVNAFKDALAAEADKVAEATERLKVCQECPFKRKPVALSLTGVLIGVMPSGLKERHGSIMEYECSVCSCTMVKAYVTKDENGGGGCPLAKW